MNDVIEKAKIFVKEHLGLESTGHDYHHVMRVYKMALFLAEDEKVDKNIIALAALMHDLDDPKIAHENSNLAETFLAENVSNEIKKEVLSIIENMSYSAYKKGKSVVSLEGQIVQDADRLDALGAIGIARTFAYGGRNNRVIFNDDKDDFSAIGHFYQKLLLLKDLMNTEKAKIIAKERTDFMNSYLSEFYKEWNND